MRSRIHLLYLVIFLHFKQSLYDISHFFCVFFLEYQYYYFLTFFKTNADVICIVNALQSGARIQTLNLARNSLTGTAVAALLQWQSGLFIYLTFKYIYIICLYIHYNRFFFDNDM